MTQRAFTAWLRRLHVAPRDVVRMTAVERDELYRTAYWDAVGADRIGDGVDLAVFDFGVNSGPARALKALGAVTAPDGAAAVRTLCARRLSFLHALRTFGAFGRGWTARVVACEALGVRMAEHARIGISPNAATVPQVATTLQAHARAAARRARAASRAGGVIAVTGSVAQPAAMAGTHVPWIVLGLATLGLLGAVGALLWRARQSRLRAAAYEAVATA